MKNRAIFDEIRHTTAIGEPDCNLVTKNWNLKIQDGYGRHLENRFFGLNSSTDCPISAKFGMRKQNGMSTRATWQKLQIFKIYDGGRPPFENRKIATSQWKIVRFWWNLVHYIRYWTQCQSRNQKLKFLKFKMAVAAILKIAFLAITRQPIVRFRRNFVWGSRTACR